MARVGFARWLLSWVTKPLVAARQSFDRVFGIVKAAAPSVTKSLVAGAYRAAEKALSISPYLRELPRNIVPPMSAIVESRLGAPRRYLVTFDVKVRDPATRVVTTHPYTMYFNERMTLGGYEQAFLGSRMGDSDIYDEEILGAAVESIEHNMGWEY